MGGRMAVLGQSMRRRIRLRASGRAFGSTLWARSLSPYAGRWRPALPPLSAQWPSSPCLFCLRSSAVSARLWHRFDGTAFSAVHQQHSVEKSTSGPGPMGKRASVPVQLSATARQDPLPAVPGRAGLAKNLHVLHRVDTLVARHPALRELVEEPRTFHRPAAEGEDSAVRLAAVGEGLPLLEHEVQQPFPTTRLLQPDGAPFAVVEDGGGFADGVVGEAIRHLEKQGRDVTGRLFAQADDPWGVIRYQLCPHCV